MWENDCSTHHVKFRRGPLDGALAGGRRDHEDEESKAGEEEGEAGGDVAVQLEVLVQRFEEGDPQAGQEKHGPGSLRERGEEVGMTFVSFRFVSMLQESLYLLSSALCTITDDELKEE